MYFNPVEVIETNNWQAECREKQQMLHIKNPIVITSKGNLKRCNLSKVFAQKSIFKDVTPDPTFESCQKTIEYIEKVKFDGVIAIGGGSVMDTAKVVMASIGTGIKNLPDLITETEPYKYRVPSIFIPTTHGTGSEVTMWSTLWNMKEKKKYSLSHPDLYPRIAILDGNLTSSLPLDISIITSMDALSHSFEAIWNKNANSESTEYAIESICLILENVERLKKDQTDLTVRKALLKASNISGLAFSNTKTAAAHSISYPLTINYGMPHGIASSISLIPLLDINKEKITDQINQICSYNDITYNELKEKIKGIPYGIIPFTLKKWGITKDQLPRLAKKSFTKGRMENNIVDLSITHILDLLESIY